jgi:hypothetical protein
MRNAKSIFSQYLGVANAVIVTAAVIVFLFPNLIVWGFFMLILPGIIMGFLPTAAIYLVLFSIAWFVLNRKHAGLAILTGIGVVWAVGFYFPNQLNQATAVALEDAKPREREPAAPLTNVRVVAIDTGYPYWSDSCGDLCQVLLFNGEVEHVILIPPAGPPPKNYRAVSPDRVAYRIAPAADCLDNPDKLLRAGARWLSQEDAEQTKRVVLTRIATGECLVREQGVRAAVDLTIRTVDENRDRSRVMTLSPQPVESKGLVLLDSAGRVVAAKVKHTAQFYSVPLVLAPNDISGGGSIGFSGWKWATYTLPKPVQQKAAEEDGDLALLKRFTTLQLNPPAGASPEKLRSEIDRVLADASVPSNHAAFALFEIYYRELTEDGLIAGDADRLVRIIGDDRITSFHQIPRELLRQRAIGTRLKEPILDRLVRLSESKPEFKNEQSYRALEELISALPEGSFRQPDPRIDRLLSSRKWRIDSPHLVERLAERGAVIAPTLVDYLKEAWRPGREVPASREQTEPVLRAVCALGPAGRASLADLRSMESSIPKYTRESMLWRATLISLGADAVEFPPPDKYSKNPEYQKRLKDFADKGCRPAS